MAENDMISEVNKSGFKEAVCIDAIWICSPFHSTGDFILST